MSEHQTVPIAPPCDGYSPSSQAPPPGGYQVAPSAPPAVPNEAPPPSYGDIYPGASPEAPAHTGVSLSPEGATYYPPGGVPPYPPPVSSGPYPPPDGQAQYPPPGPSAPSGAGPFVTPVALPQDATNGSYPPPAGVGQYPPSGGGEPYPPPGGTGQYPPPGGAGQYPPPGGAGQYPIPDGIAPYPPTNDTAYPPSSDPAYPPGNQPIPGTETSPCTPAQMPLETDLGGTYVTARNERSRQIQLVDCRSVPDFLIPAGNKSHIDQMHKKVADDDGDVGGNCLGGCFSLIGHICFFVCIYFLVVELRKKNEAPASEYYNNTGVICSAVALAVSYLIIVIEASCSNTFSYLDNIMDREEAVMHTEKTRALLPYIKWHVSCYHNETRTVHYTTTEDGQTVHRTRQETRRVDTYAESERFNFTRCTDASGSLPDWFRGGEATRVEFEKTYGFIDVATKTAFKYCKQNIQDRNRHRDKYMDFSEDFSFGPYEQRITVFVNKNSRPECMRRRCFILLSMCLLSWPYRYWFREATKKRKFCYVKLLGL